MRKKGNKSNIGAQGEQQATTWLASHNFKILETNFRYRQLEIDIIAIDKTNNELVFVEVKKRNSKQFGHPSLAVDQKKLSNLTTAASVYLNSHQLELDFRFDIISILPDKIEHFKNITADW